MQPEQNQKRKENLSGLGMRKRVVWCGWTYPTALTDSAMMASSLQNPAVQFRQLDLTCWNPYIIVSVTN